MPKPRAGEAAGRGEVAFRADVHRYLVAMLGDRVNWVANVRAADGKATLRHGKREAVQLEEVDAGSRAPILRR